ncbi:MAG: cyclic nucleotide-binding domain-containing protein [Desulfobacterales bacterium]|nr:cyclic nucleotide-binding domain-containing protein [Desulfobacterales bacterium]
MDEWIQKERQVDQLVQQNKIETATQRLFELIVYYAKKKEFPKAESLREKLIQVDDMALTEIIKSDEIIEAEKNSTLNQDRVKLWTLLFNDMSMQERNALYFNMQEMIVDSGETVLKQSDMNSRLFFVQQGQLNASYTIQGKEIFIKSFEAGSIFGEDSFFEISVSTYCVTALSKCVLTFIEREILDKWNNEFPALEAKLFTYCQKQEKISDIVTHKKMERRVYKRLKVKGNLSFQLLNFTGNPTGKILRGSLLDISIAGISFSIKSARKDQVKLLLGRSILIQFNLPKGDSDYTIERNGIIIGVSSQLYNDYYINVKFDKLLTEKIILAAHTFLQ